MLDAAKVKALRDGYDINLTAFVAQKAKLEAEMATLQEQYNLRQRQVNATVQQIIETQAALSAFDKVLDREPVAS